MQEEELIAKWEAAQVVVSQKVEAVQTLKNDKASKEDILAAVDEMKKAKEEYSALVRGTVSVLSTFAHPLISSPFFLCRKKPSSPLTSSKSIVMHSKTC